MVTCNLAPAEVRKIGSGFDLPIAACVLGGMDAVPKEALDGFFMVGELSLEGRLRPVRGVLPIVIAARANGAKGLILPRDNELEAAVVDGLDLYPVETLEDVAALLRGERVPETRSVDPRSLFRQAAEHGEDLRDVKGQEQVKRTLEIAAAGTHHQFIIGPPVSGKRILSGSFGTILI